MAADKPRQRLVASAIALMCERGVHATGLTDLLEHSKTARASLYQHFPGGKSELMEQATYAAGRQIGKQLDALFDQDAPERAVAGIIDLWKQILTSSDYAMGCPIQAASQAGPAEPEIQAASAAVFAAWNKQIADGLVRAGVDAGAVVPLASLVISSVEGAITQSRSAKSTEPLDNVRSLLGTLVSAAATATSV